MDEEMMMQLAQAQAAGGAPPEAMGAPMGAPMGAEMGMPMGAPAPQFPSIDPAAISGPAQQLAQMIKQMQNDDLMRFQQMQSEAMQPVVQALMSAMGMPARMGEAAPMPMGLAEQAVDADMAEELPEDSESEAMPEDMGGAY